MKTELGKRKPTHKPTHTNTLTHNRAQRACGASQFAGSAGWFFLVLGSVSGVHLHHGILGTVNALSGTTFQGEQSSKNCGGAARCAFLFCLCCFVVVVF